MTAIVLVGALAAACGDPPRDPAGLAPRFHREGDGRRPVVVDANGRGAAKTIQGGITMAPAGGRVRVLPGTYNEALVIDKGLILEGVGGEEDDADDDHDRGGQGGPVIVSAPGVPTATIEVATPDPVTIRHLTVLKPGVNGILGNGVVNITLEHLTMIAVGVGPGTNRLVRMVNDASQSGGRAYLVIRENFLDGGNLGSLGVSLQADIETVIERNVFRRTGSSLCIFVESFGPAGINADIVDNDLDQCHGRTAIDVGPTPTQTGNFGTLGVVNIVGNKIRNSLGSCIPTTAIHYQLYTGRIERNSITGFLQQCAVSITDALPGAIWVGSLRGFPPASPVVRFNDIEGNAHAGLRVAPNITTPIDASCNYWGSATGTTSSAWPPGTGDAVVVEAGGATECQRPLVHAPESGDAPRLGVQ
jgi:hypothetical protein